MDQEIAKANLLQEIDAGFPPIEMPAFENLAFHPSGCLHCDYTRKYLEEYRGKPVTPELIRWLHDDLSCLSPPAMRWLLPFYLKRCLEIDAGYDPIELEFLVYDLGPSPGHQAETRQRLSLLNTAQIACLIHFLEWCLGEEHWRQYFPKDIEKAILFLRLIEPVR